MAKEKQLHRQLVRIWQEVIDNQGEYIPYPHGCWKDSFEDLAGAVDHEIIKLAFRGWATGPRLYPGDPGLTDFEKRYPIEEFLKVAAEWTRIAGKALQRITA